MAQNTQNKASADDQMAVELAVDFDTFADLCRELTTRQEKFVLHT